MSIFPTSRRLTPDPELRARYGTNYALSVTAKRERELEPQWILARSAMEQLGRLDRDWDGYGAEPVSIQVRLNAWHALDCFRASGLVPKVLPNANGTVSFEWETPSVVAHFQIGKGRYSMYARPAKGETLYFDGDVRELAREVPDALAKIIDAPGPAQTDQAQLVISASAAA